MTASFIPYVGKDSERNNEIGNMDLNRGVYVLQKLSRPCSEVKTAPCISTVDGKLPDHVEVSPDGRTINDATMNFQPRLGLAYRLTSKTAIRASGGVFFDNWSAITQLVRGKAGSWPSIGSVSPTNLNYPTLAQPTPSVPATDPLPSAVVPAPTPFTRWSTSWTRTGRTPTRSNEFQRAARIEPGDGAERRLCRLR